MFSCLRTARRLLPFHHREKHVVSVPAWNGYLGSGLHPLTHGSGCGLLILIYLFLTSRSDAPFPQKIIFSGLRPNMEKVSASCGRILLKCSSLLSSPKGNPFPLYGVPWKNFVLPQERKLQKMGGLFTHFPPRQRSGNYLSIN